MTQNLSKMNVNQLRDIAEGYGAIRKHLYGTSKQALIIKIHNFEKAQEEMARERARR